MKKLILFLIFIFTISHIYSQKPSIPEISKAEIINLIDQAKKDGEIPLPTDPKAQKITIIESKVIYFIGEKEVSKKELKMLNPDSVDNIQVFKTKEEIPKHTDKECDGIVIINLKKQI